MRFVGDRAPSGAAELTGWILPSGSSHRHPWTLRGFADAAEALPSGCAGATRDRFLSLPSGTRSGCRPSGTATSIGSMEPDKAETLCLPHDVRVRGTPRELARTAKRPAGLDGAETRGSIGTRRYQSPWEHRAVRSGNAAPSQRTPRWNKASRSAERVAHRGNTGADARRTTRGHANW
jgi:hypothetical protein